MGTLLYPAIGVYFAAIEDDLVVFDSRHDSYACIPEGVAELGFDAESLTFSPPAAAAMAAILDAGLASLRPDAPPQAELPALPSVTYGFQTPVAVPLRDAWRLAGCALDLLVHYRRRPLSHIVGFIGGRRSRLRARAPAADVAALAARFRTASVWLPNSQKCLVRSFLLLCFLHRSGCDAQWVFGVRTWPFGAHCWLQSGDAVLDDAVEALRLYRPIRVA
jgi:hypothetical protein